MFGGEVTLESVALLSPGSPPYYYLMNFNSFMSSIVTLFHFMIVNNWFVTIDMYREVMQSKSAVYFFICFWVTL